MLKFSCLVLLTMLLCSALLLRPGSACGGCSKAEEEQKESSSTNEDAGSDESSAEEKKKQEEEEEEADLPHFLQVQYDDSIIFNEDSGTPEISYHFFKFNKNKRPIILVQNKKVDGDKFYSLLMLDPDAPNRDDPEFADWLHWGLYNIPGDLLKYGALDVEEHAASGFNMFDVFAEYNPPAPPRKSGPHRYHFVLLEQEDAIIRVIPRVRNRAGFDLAAYSDAYKMKELVRASFTTENQ